MIETRLVKLLSHAKKQIVFQVIWKVSFLWHRGAMAVILIALAILRGLLH